LAGHEVRYIVYKEPRELDPGADAELAVRISEVELDRLDTEKEHGGSFAVGGSLGHDEGNLELLRREAGGCLRVTRTHTLAATSELRARLRCP
jgi:hypothetical protein